MLTLFFVSDPDAQVSNDETRKLLVYMICITTWFGIYERAQGGLGLPVSCISLSWFVLERFNEVLSFP